MVQPDKTHSLCQSLREQHQRVWNMAVHAAKNFPEQHWAQGSPIRLIPARLVYHILMGAERYTWAGDPEQILAQRRFNRNWIAAPVEQLLHQQDALAALETMRQTTDAWLQALGDEGLVNTPARWAWTGGSMLDQTVYMLRHNQYHVADLNQQLRILNLPTSKWE